MAYNLAQKVSGSAKTTITDIEDMLTNIDTLSLCNIHATDAVAVDLYVASQVTTDVTSTTVVAAETEAVSTSSVTLTVKTVSATADALLNEKVYKSDGTLFGTCTAVGSTTGITFGDGLSQKLVDNDNLYIGVDHFFLNSVVIPFGTSLKLEEDELKKGMSCFDKSKSCFTT